MARSRRDGWWRRFRTYPFRRWLAEGPPWRRAMRATALFTALSVLVPGVATAVVLSAYLFLPLPSALPEERPTVESQISTVYAIDGTPIGQFREAALGVSVKGSEISQHFKDAVIAVEDHDFFAHGGVDFGAIMRAFMANLSARRIEQGGSTITQQLVKNLYTGKDRSIVRKLREALFAAQLERQMSKNEILNRYLNTVYLGDSNFGVEAAARSYFRKSAKDLTLSESALLAGLIPAPSRYSPRTHPEAAEERRLLVLRQVRKRGLATRAEVQAARADRPVIHPVPGVEGRYPYFMDYVRVYLREVKGYTYEQIYKGGLRIETSLDPRLQEEAERVIRETLPDPALPEAAMAAVEPRTGFVRALVGGKDWETNRVNLALGKLSGGSFGRQTGSSFKPFVLAQALEAGITPDTVYPGPSCLDLPGYRPCNYSDSGFGASSLRRAIALSINTVFVQLILDVGVRETAELAKRLGVDHIDLDDEERLGPAISIGAQESSPLEMASAFSVFAARGLRAEPTPVVRVVDANGRVLEDNTRPETDRVLKQVVADTLNEMLTGVITGGTGRAADIGRPAAGKTGTAQRAENAWFVGYTPSLSTAFWMGFKEGNIPMQGILGRGEITGGSLPAAMWADFMETALKDVPKTKFTEPAPLDALQAEVLRRQRSGFDPGTRRYPTSFGGGEFYTPPPEPVAPSPPAVVSTTSSSTSSTTSSSTSSSTTTTTGPGPIFP